MKKLFLLTLTFVATCSANEIRVLVWDEQRPQQKQAYGELFLGETIAAHLKRQPGLRVKTARLDDAEQGLSDASLDATDVLIIWCHKRVKDQNNACAEAVVKRVLDGKLSLIALHSAHWAKPFDSPCRSPKRKVCWKCVLLRNELRARRILFALKIERVRNCCSAKIRFFRSRFLPTPASPI